jgi:MoaA/NifB/PqqE/SkfB family radical SAM enzyme
MMKACRLPAGRRGSCGAGRSIVGIESNGAVKACPSLPSGDALFGRRGNNPLCHHRALQLLKQGRRERLVRVEEAPGESFDHGIFETVEEPWPDAELERAHAVAEERERWLLGP